MATRKYTKRSCHTTKTAAKKKAKAMRARGMTAQVRKSDGKHCIFSAGRRKKAAVGSSRKRKTTSKRRRSTKSRKGR